MQMATFVLLISAATAVQAQDDVEARIRRRLESEIKIELARTQKRLHELVLKELSLEIGERSLGARVERFAGNLVDDEAHGRLKKFLLSKGGKEIVRQIMDEQGIDDFDAIVDSYFEKEKGRFRIREEFEELLNQLLDEVERQLAPAPGTIGIDLVIDKAKPDAAGLRVAGVTAGGPASAAGLKAGDVVFSVGGRNLTSSNVEEIMKSLKPGQDVKIVYERDQVRKTVTVRATP